MKYDALKEETCQLNLELPRHGLVAWTSGNVSVRDPRLGVVAIKPSGLRYDELTPDKMVVLDLDGKVLEGTFKPSSDTASHLYIYRQREDLCGVVHTHSTYATAFAAVNQPIPVVLTAIADEFGGPVPVGRFALIGGEEIGKAVIEVLGNSPAVLLKNHGVFTVGKSGLAAVKAAVMVEDIARTVWVARQLGTADVIPRADVDKLHHRYTHVYGQ